MVKEEKLEKVKTLKQELEKSPVIVFIDMHKMPSKQLQEIRKGLRGVARIKMVKKSTLKFAIDYVEKEGVKELETHIPTQPAIAFTDMEAFKLYKFVDGLRFKTYAKEGDIATEDVWVSAGPTNLVAGPVISELQQAGVPASIESGMIKIRKDVCIVKKGEEIPAVKAGVLRKLKIEPMEVTLNVVAIYEKGSIYTKDALEITKTFPDMIIKAFNNAMNLSVFIAFPTKENIKNLIAKAARSANAIRGLVGGTAEPAEEEEESAEGPKEDAAGQTGGASGSEESTEPGAGSPQKEKDGKKTEGDKDEK